MTTQHGRGGGVDTKRCARLAVPDDDDEGYDVVLAGRESNDVAPTKGLGFKSRAEGLGREKEE
ncbi:hypothetical protein RRF57_012782 [Xylaria bambusicola]|uniref:Uncharacterized protein n=1 Tax=Xylaria bambusicola TaxID=326684 RepID=A0AAN7Z4T3_9PEZI